MKLTFFKKPNSYHNFCFSHHAECFQTYENNFIPTHVSSYLQYYNFIPKRVV
jgi:hypothetical protein